MSFTVNGTIKAMFTPEGGSPEEKQIANMLVELWHKSPLEVVFLGSGLTAADGFFDIDFKVDSASPILSPTNDIEQVFMKVYYKNQLVVGDIDSSDGSFD